MGVACIYTVSETKLPIWFHALTHCPFDINFSVSRRRSASYDNRPLIYVRDIYVNVDKKGMLDFIGHFVSHICYSKGFIQNLTKKENPNVRETHRQVPEKVCPSTGEACKHDNGSGHCVCEGESEQRIAERFFGWGPLDPSVREEISAITTEYLGEIKSSELGDSL